MAVLLRREGTRGHAALLNNRGWSMLVTLAYERGWRPAGTEPPRHWEHIAGDMGMHRTVGPLSIVEGPEGPVAWPRADYASARGQLVTAHDARAMAQALASVVDDLPDHDPLEDKAELDLGMATFPRLRMADGKIITNPPEAFGGPNKRPFKQLVMFLSGGAFRIW